MKKRKNMIVSFTGFAIGLKPFLFALIQQYLKDEKRV